MLTTLPSCCGCKKQWASELNSSFCFFPSLYLHDQSRTLFLPISLAARGNIVFLALRVCDSPIPTPTISSKPPSPPVLRIPNLKHMWRKWNCFRSDHLPFPSPNLLSKMKNCARVCYSDRDLSFATLKAWTCKLREIQHFPFPLTSIQRISAAIDIKV